jgi:DNA-binding MarR family transcriptional regulator
VNESPTVPGAAARCCAGHAGPEADERIAAIREVETEFGEMITQFKRIIHQNAERLAPGMNPGAYRIFTAIVRHGPVKASEISERMMLDKGQLSRAVRELEQLGLVARTADPNDKRAHLLEATEEGSRRLDDARLPHEHMLYDTLLGWDLDRVHDLASLLRALTRGEAPEPR